MPLLEASLREAHRICAPRALVIDMTPPLGSCVGDPDALHQLLRLLFFSAVDRSPDTATISFSAGWRDNVVVISISDDGPGLPRARLSRLFDVRGPSADSAQDAGLIVAGAIVRAHGGSIQAEPIEPHGVRIRALVPTAAEGAMRAVVVGDQRNA
jgi:two-component system sensor histidine kinase KdpD